MCRASLMINTKSPQQQQLWKFPYSNKASLIPCIFTLCLNIRLIFMCAQGKHVPWDPPKGNRNSYKGLPLPSAKPANWSFVKRQISNSRAGLMTCFWSANLWLVAADNAGFRSLVALKCSLLVNWLNASSKNCFK